MNCQECNEQLSEYSLGLLDPTDARRVTEHLASGCESCRQTLESIDVATSTLASELPEMLPPKDLKEQLMNAVREKQLTNRPFLPSHSQTSYSQGSQASDEYPSSEDKRVNRLRDSRLTSRLHIRMAVVATAAGILGAFLGYSVTSLVNRDRLDFSEQEAFDSDRFRADLSVRREKSAASLRLVSLPISNTTPVNPTGYMAFDLISKQLHVAIQLEKRTNIKSLLGCEAVSVDGTRQVLGEFTAASDALSLSIFDLPETITEIAKIVIVEHIDQGQSEKNRRELMIFDVDPEFLGIARPRSRE